MSASSEDPPIAAFSGRISYEHTPHGVDAAVLALTRQLTKGWARGGQEVAVGFDLEWKPNFKAGMYFNGSLNGSLMGT